MARKKRNSKKRTQKDKPTKVGALTNLNDTIYVIDEPGYERLEVRNTANAWWLNREKLNLFIAAKKMGANDIISRYSAGITENQLRYFLEIHPDFSPFFDQIKAHPKLMALHTVVSRMADPEIAQWYLERRLKEEFGTRHDINVSNNLSEYAESLRKMSEEDMDKELKKCRIENKKKS